MVTGVWWAQFHPRSTTETGLPSEPVSTERETASTHSTSGEIGGEAAETLDSNVPPPDFDPEEMVFVPAGPFIFGAGREYPGDTATKTINLPAFYLDKYEVTNAQYQKFVQATGHPPPEYWNGTEYPEGKAYYPVEMVSWYDALAYAEWAGKRLPTEFEWEKAARGTDGRRWPWGNEFEAVPANVRHLQIGDTVPVFRFPESASPYGCLHLAGNVWEWTASKYDQAYNWRVLRGGCWLADEISARCAHRYGMPPDRRSRYVGFRCARDAEPP